ncbi:FecR family protein [Sphingomonas sp. HF-S4]|uniref:FecR family protein n=1 Tax=Sphingomonas agrestis TaxID=3080540 RepID=A0ABU3Y683_9SPHN|nr:FecR family protein [Sphingomonas sp. HF-S4]MDV3456879.1 FecR family protein [Sphingomonas sp. HF-S4]
MVTSHPLLRKGADAEAAAWLARLQDKDRSPATEEAFKAWAHADPAHEEAFERATEIWAMIPGAMLCADAPSATPVQLPVRRAPAWRVAAYAMAASLLVAIGAGGGWWLLSDPHDYATRVGEQKVATLEDGSRIALNTDTEIDVAYDAKTRRVTLSRGEAMFEVAPNAARPFLVRAGNRQVRAIGTSFIVRRDANGVVVTLIQGKVSVTDVSQRAARPTMLAPGERLTAGPGSATPLIDQPQIDAATAWRRGQAVFNDTPLAAAIAELNRYGGPRISVDDPHLASLRISGVFATNDTAEFANAVAALHRLRVEKMGAELHLLR